MRRFNERETAVIRDAMAAPNTWEGLDILERTFGRWGMAVAAAEVDRLRALESGAGTAQRAAEAVDPARRYAAWVTIRRVMSGQRIQLADGSLLTRESLADLVDQASCVSTRPPVRAVEQAGQTT